MNTVDSRQADQPVFRPAITPTPGATTGTTAPGSVATPAPGVTAPTDPGSYGRTSTRIASNADQQLQWQRDQYANIRRLQDAANGNTARFAGSVGADGDAASAAASMDRGTYEDSFRPVDERLASDALRFSSGAYGEHMAGAAKADVGSSIDASNTAMQQRLGRAGMSLTPGQMMSMKRGSELTRASLSASAGTDARLAAERMGSERLTAAAGRGAQLQGQADQGIRTSTDTRTTSANLSQAPANNERIMGNYQGGIAQSYEDSRARAGAIWSGQAQEANAAADARRERNRETAGVVAGLLISDPKKKKNAKKMDGEKAERAIADMDSYDSPGNQAEKAIVRSPSYVYDYEEGVNTNGRGPGKHVTPMADDMAKVIGGNGETVDEADWMGLQQAAMSNMIKRLDAIERKQTA